jgi:hydrogenase maturation factor HypF (carbamoyltransferase family)
MIGGEMAIKEPARLLISILVKIPNSKFQIPNKPQKSILKSQKDFVFSYVKKYYSENEFEVLWNQLEQKFNCLETSSTARILDAVSVLLGFSKNERLSKHGPIELLEKNSTIPYKLKPKLENYKLKITNSKQITNSNLPAGGQESNDMLILNTTYLFEYLIKNINKDKKRLGATAQKYIADGLLAIIQHTKYNIQDTFFAGGMANNKIISSILESKGTHTNKKIPRGDAGISFGQIIFQLLTNPRD